MYTKTLVLNYGVPYKITNWKIAIKNMFLGKYLVIKDYPEIVSVISHEIMNEFPGLKNSIRHVLDSSSIDNIPVFVPAVVQMMDKENHPHPIRFSKINVCSRDKFRCQYCGQKSTLSKLTFDHVVPRSLGGRTSWENVVMACHECNFKKSNRTPRQANMKLINNSSHVKKPKYLPMNTQVSDTDVIPSEWNDFILNF